MWRSDSSREGEEDQSTPLARLQKAHRIWTPDEPVVHRCETREEWLQKQAKFLAFATDPNRFGEPTPVPEHLKTKVTMQACCVRLLMQTP